MLALRVSKIDPNEGHEGHNHAPPKKTKRVKGLWTVRIEPQQEAKEEMYYVWLWEGSQIKRQVYAGLALLVIFAVVLYPLWPLKMRQGVYYLSWGFLILLGLFFLMAIFRVILFCVTYFATPPGLWLFPNLWEDVSFLDSFKPVWAWHEVCISEISKGGGRLLTELADPEEEEEVVDQGLGQRPGYLLRHHRSARARQRDDHGDRHAGRYQRGEAENLYSSAG